MTLGTFLTEYKDFVSSHAKENRLRYHPARREATAHEGNILIVGVFLLWLEVHMLGSECGALCKN